MGVETLQSPHLYIHQILTEVLEGFLYRKLRTQGSASSEYAVRCFSKQSQWQRFPLTLAEAGGKQNPIF